MNVPGQLSILTRLVASFRQLLAAYGALFMAEQRWVGALVLAATLCDPATGIAGLLAGIASMLTRRLLGLGVASSAEVLNGLYVGLVLGAFHVFDIRLAGLAVLGGGLVPLLSAALVPALQRAGGIPLLGAPFLGVAWVLLPAARAVGIPLRTAFPVTIETLPDGLHFLLVEIGALFYVGNPLSGLLVLAAALVASRAFTLLLIAGGAIAWGLVMLFGVVPGSSLPLLATFNGALAAMVLGGMLTTLSYRAVGVAALGVVIATALSAGLLVILWPLAIPPLSAPYLFTVWLLRASLRADLGAVWSRHWLHFLARPEADLASRRLARARGVDPLGIALLPPFHGTMEISQGLDGLHTHQGPWRYALDFVCMREGRSFSGAGAALTDYLCFDMPVLSPAWGVVASCQDGIPDNMPGSINLTENWGNHVLIALSSGDYVLLAHLRQGSINVVPGQSVQPGIPLGRCGNSGRSSQPHLHLHVQRGYGLGAPTRPFHLSAFLSGGTFVLDSLLDKGSRVEVPPPAPPLAGALALLVGRNWKFRIDEEIWSLSVEAGILGDIALVSQRGARVQAVASEQMLALFKRQGARDIALDAFMFAFGLTPCAEAARHWRDAPLTDIMPLTPLQRLRVALRHPFGANLASSYERHWDAARGVWVQRGSHRLTALGGDIRAESEGLLSELEGPVGFGLEMDGKVIVHAELAGYGNRGDHGIPAWSADYSNALV